MSVTATAAAVARPLDRSVHPSGRADDGAARPAHPHRRGPRPRPGPLARPRHRRGAGPARHGRRARSSTSAAGPAGWSSAWPTQGVPALGVDSSPSAVALARRRGATVLAARRLRPPARARAGGPPASSSTAPSASAATPPASWPGAASSPAAGGRVVAEVEPPGTGWRRLTAWFERDGRPQPVLRLGRRGRRRHRRPGPPRRLRVAALAQTPSGRWFADLRRRRPAPAPSQR